MNPVSRLFRLGRRGPEEPALAALERAIQTSARTLQEADPETDRQWRVLQASIESRQEAPSVRFRPLRPAIALGLVASAVILALVLPDWQGKIVTHETGRGQQLTITLADSTEVVLNHTSRIVVENGRESRAVRLEGEAFFRVRKSSRPFIVTTDLGTARVLGTEFNVRSRAEELEVAVLRGSVRVASERAHGETAVVLHQGELTVVSGGGEPREPAPLRYTDYPGWLHGKLIFERATLAEVCREIEDCFDVGVSIGLPPGESGTITGVLDARTPESAVRTLARLTGYNYRHDQSGYTLY